ncbi:hypothetical protein MAPG_00655 [Magnaporthiopsis poae ATCC 64411]|uniref:Uncharacterized protein n=1 Tax=Magnaporthiopsis poae (strain ATCC 64411 / 73-15) TaxID=644358 RepID=A0A0C4DLL1_MAGP6|nr:hypothetical protein MAPG_00655 [Magnaporthiopsis poae ATCC 64411]
MRRGSHCDLGFSSLRLHLLGYASILMRRHAYRAKGGSWASDQAYLGTCSLSRKPLADWDNRVSQHRGPTSGRLSVQGHPDPDQDDARDHYFDATFRCAIPYLFPAPHAGFFVPSSPLFSPR